MLTDKEKQILGHMVDMGILRGQSRIDAGADDELARELIADFSAQMLATMPTQIEFLNRQKNELEEKIIEANLMLDLIK